jgi:hypothetical protein
MENNLNATLYDNIMQDVFLILYFISFTLGIILILLGFSIILQTSIRLA